MSYEGVIDPASSAALASVAADQTSGMMVRAAQSATAAAGSAADAAASKAAITALLSTFGVDHRWSGTVLQIRLPDGSYGAAVDLKGDKGDKGDLGPTPRVGTVTVGDAAVILDASDPARPVYNFVQPRPTNGWSPVLALVADGARRVQQVADWTGGFGTKPAVGLYVGPAGYVATAALAIDLRGAVGVSGSNFVAASTTSTAIALGTVSVVLTVATQQGYAPAQYLSLISASDPRFAMAGLFQSYEPVSGTLTLQVLVTSGTGMRSDWTVTPSMPLTVPAFVDDGVWDGASPAASVTIGYAPTGSSNSSDDGLY